MYATSLSVFMIGRLHLNIYHQISQHAQLKDLINTANFGTYFIVLDLKTMSTDKIPPQNRHSGNFRLFSDGRL